MSLLFLTSYFLLLTFSGCFRPDPELDRIHEITSTLKPLTEAGLTLDQQATPQQVVYALLQVLKDDVRSEGDSTKREQAFDRTLALAAPNEIMIRFNRKGETREETLQRVVRLWGAVVAYYVDALDAPVDQLTGTMKASPLERNRFNQEGTTELQRITHTLLDPAAPEDRNRRAVLDVHLSKESEFWRICYVGFAERPLVRPKKDTKELSEPPSAG